MLFGWSLIGFRALAILAGAATIVVAALVARDLGGGRRAQTLAAVAVGFSPILVATNGLFQPVSFDQFATMMVLWLSLRLALGRGSWPLLGLAVGVGLETKYTLAVVAGPAADDVPVCGVVTCSARHGSRWRWQSQLRCLSRT